MGQVGKDRVLSGICSSTRTEESSVKTHKTFVTWKNAIAITENSNNSNNDSLPLIQYGVEIKDFAFGPAEAFPKQGVDDDGGEETHAASGGALQQEIAQLQLPRDEDFPKGDEADENHQL